MCPHPVHMYTYMHTHTRKIPAAIQSLLKSQRILLPQVQTSSGCMAESQQQS